MTEKLGIVISEPSIEKYDIRMEGSLIDKGKDERGVGDKRNGFGKLGTELRDGLDKKEKHRARLGCLAAVERQKTSSATKFKMKPKPKSKSKSGSGQSGSGDLFDVSSEDEESEETNEDRKVVNDSEPETEERGP